MEIEMTRPVFSDLPPELIPTLGESYGAWTSRVAVYDAAHPSTLTPIDTAALNTILDYSEEVVSDKQDTFSYYQIPTGTRGPGLPWTVTGRSYVLRLGTIIWLSIEAVRDPKLTPLTFIVDRTVCRLPREFGGPDALQRSLPESGTSAGGLRTRIVNIEGGESFDIDVTIEDPNGPGNPVTVQFAPPFTNDALPASSYGYDLFIQGSLSIGPPGFIDDPIDGFSNPSLPVWPSV